ncbi:MATE family efflux transporter [Yoonia vestfoldensis]|jgi:MATE family multidrug resistance protein|uniref:Multidrug-efflux transporter n=1 Tax=Yoonia vestfoldensis TaxID=245188 RepID=A0A1Y0E7X7_9RHOB|nr:MATE family efflux transporter [Yoonia vestfoldensis]ART99528.1 multidrug resistance protein NorM [Yoonia vestfoldensis]
MPTQPSAAIAQTEVAPLLRLALPIVAGLAASTLIGVVDTLMIAPLGTLPLAAASLTTAAMIIFYSAIYGFVSAVGIEAAHRHGGAQADAVAAALRAGLVLAPLMGLVAAVFMGLILVSLPFIGQPPDVLAIITPYWLAMAALLVPVALLMVIAQVLNAMDRPWTAAGFAFLAVVLNIPLNYLLIWGVGDWPGLGLIGAGLASLIAETLALLVAISWLARHGLLRARPDPALRRRLARDGLPLAIGYTGEGAAFAVIGLMLGIFGATALAANQIVQAVGGVLYMLPLGMAAAVAIRIGQASGSGDPTRLRPIAIAAIGVVTTWMIAVTITLILSGSRIAAALSTDSAVVALATAMFVIVALIQVADGVQSTALGALRGIMDFVWPTRLTLASYWFFALPLAALLGFWAELGPLGIWAGYGIGITLVAIILPLRFWRLTAAANR